MKTENLKYTKPNEAWILHQEEMHTTQDGSCNIYLLLDAYSEFLFGQEISVDLPTKQNINNLLKNAYSKSGSWPQQFLILKKDPFVDTFQEICEEIKIPLKELTAKEMQPLVQGFRNSFRQFKMGGPQTEKPRPMTDVEEEELAAFIPETYAPCPCASGKKFKFCCQKIFKEITFAMCDAQDGHLNKALQFMKEAEDKVGRTAEVVCRHAICWSFFDINKSLVLIKEALIQNPKHPRANYVMGIDSVAKGNFEKALEYYQTAIDNYPEGDRFHLNETYNNMGTAYYNLKKYKEAKDVWEKGLVLLPTDLMIKNNLYKFIYGNPTVPNDLRQISPYIEKYLTRRL
jgi:tetratricopeptide (TPR) repeat protein